MIEKKISEQLSDAYMMGDQEKIAELKQKSQDYADSIQKQAEKFNPVKVNNILNDDNAPSSKIYHFLNGKFGEDWYDLEFETIERLLWVDFGTVLEDTTRDKIWAIKYLCGSQRPFLDWWMFNQIAVALSGFIADFEFIRSPSPGMVINAVNTMVSIRPEEPFSREVKKYISILLISEGIYIPPPNLMSIIKDEFEDMVSPEMKSKWSSILNRYKEMLTSKKYQVKEDIEDIQAKRLLKTEEAATQYGS